MISAQDRDPIMTSPTVGLPSRGLENQCSCPSLKQLFLSDLKQIFILNQFEPTVFLTECLIQKSLDFYEYLNRRNVYVILSDLNDLIF